MTMMNEHSVLKMVCGCVQLAARQANNPAFKAIEFDQSKGTFCVTVEDYGADAPPEVYEITATLVPQS